MCSVDFITESLPSSVWHTVLINTQGVGKVPLIDRVVVVGEINEKTNWIMNLGGSHPQSGHTFSSVETTRDQIYNVRINHFNCLICVCKCKRDFLWRHWNDIGDGHFILSRSLHSVWC